jgi:hypothetical protein
MRYTRTDSAAGAVAALADRVPVAVVTCGADGAVAVDQVSGESVQVPGLRLDALDATGAGDVFGAGFLTATLAGWPLAERVSFANLCAGLSVQQFGGSLSAPGWGDIADWWSHLRLGPRTSATSQLVRRYGFLDDVLPAHPSAKGSAVRRASATLSVLNDLPTGGTPPI